MPLIILTVVLNTVKFVMIRSDLKEIDTSFGSYSNAEKYYFANLMYEWEQGLITDVWLTESYKDCQNDRGLVRKFYGIDKDKAKIDPIVAFTFRGYTICFERSDTGFVDTVQDCPAGQVPCSDQTSTVNTVCVNPADKPAKCPVTAVSIFDIKAVDQIDTTLKDQGFEQARLEGTDNSPDWVLYFSKSGDRPPLSDLFLTEQEPCLVSNGFKSSKDKGTQN